MNAKDFLGSRAFLYVSLVIIVLIILYKLGLIGTSKIQKDKDKVDAQQDQKRLAIANHAYLWTSPYWKNAMSKALTHDQALNLAMLIHQAFGFFNDDEPHIIGAFNAIKYQRNVSQIAFEYGNKYGRDLHADLKGVLSKNEMNDIYDVILTKPS